MGLVELCLVALGLSMDAFAVSICQGLSMVRLRFKNILIIGLYFGLFQALMPALGYLLGAQFAARIRSVDHWIAFALLALIGINMIRESLSKDENCPSPDDSEGRAPAGAVEGTGLKHSKMLSLALATSIDALAAGVSFAFFSISILPAASLIGSVTLLISMAGVLIGHRFGARFKSKAELCGGIILILLGLKILLEDLGFIP